ncbi:MAG: RNA recognition motif domain-containing protein [Nannocystales bacterium]
MARSNYSAGKRQREKERAKKKKEKMERARERSRGGASTVPVATVDEIQGGMMTIDQVMKNLEGGDEEGGQDQRRATIPSRLFIGGLDWRVNDAELQKKLEEYGPVTDVHIVKDRDTGDSRGFGFVTMANRKDADQAIKQLDGQDFSGRNLVVRQATERNR